MEYLLTRSKRKTVALYVRNGVVEVRAPLWVRKAEIEKFVSDHTEWIKDKLDKSQAQQSQRDNFKLKYGDTILYRGREYPIVANMENRAGFDAAANHFYIPSGLDSAEIKATCIQTYRILAKNYILQQTLSIAKLMDVTPSVIKINSAKTRWGSCSIKKSLNFSWRLILADDETINYVIIHELAHLTEMNHSRRFWKIVESILPDYRKYKIRLKELQKKLILENWE